jgi:hypothetical protein
MDLGAASHVLGFWRNSQLHRRAYMILAFDILLRKKALGGCIQSESNKERFPNQKPVQN